MKKGMLQVTGLLGLGLLLSGIGLWRMGLPWLLPVAVTLGTTFYHFAMRLIVGYVIDGCFHNRMNSGRWWFRERKLESALYRFLGVRKWKKWVPTFAPESYDMRTVSPKQMAGATCQAEVVHELIMLLSFVPVAAIPWLGEGAVFWSTSIIAAMLDGVFVILQRFNRPRLVRLAEMQKKRRHTI